MARIFTGVKAVVKIDGTTVGFVSGVNVNEENTLTDADVIGQLDSIDLAETGHKVNFSLTMFRPNDGSNSAETLGLGSMRDPEAFKDRLEFVANILDTEGNEIYALEGAKYEGGSGSVDARGVWTGSFNFRALRGFGL